MIHDPDCECDTYGCVIRRKGLQVSPKATPSRHNRKAPRKQEPPAYNRTIITEKRPGGGQMPILNADGSPVRQKQWDHSKRKIKDQLAQVRAPQP